MTGFNHAAVGGFIGKFLPLPIALPLALASHFVLDALPHYGIPHNRRNGWVWRLITTFDFFFSWGFLGYILLSRHDWAMFACGVIAASPDFIWVARIVRTRSFDLSTNTSHFTKWHARIQHYERPWSIWVELPVAITLGYLAFTTW